jgi:hypothetical protein
LTTCPKFVTCPIISSKSLLKSSLRATGADIYRYMCRRLLSNRLPSTCAAGFLIAFV